MEKGGPLGSVRVEGAGSYALNVGFAMRAFGRPSNHGSERLEERCDPHHY